MVTRLSKATGPWTPRGLAPGVLEIAPLEESGHVFAVSGSFLDCNPILDRSIANPLKVVLATSRDEEKMALERSS
jgi:hypothetical protein